MWVRNGAIQELILVISVEHNTIIFRVIKHNQVVCDKRFS